MTAGDDMPAVLVVDDYRPALQAFSAALESLDARLVLAASAESAVAAVRLEQFALVLLDELLEAVAVLSRMLDRAAVLSLAAWRSADETTATR